MSDRAARAADVASYDSDIVSQRAEDAKAEVKTLKCRLSGLQDRYDLQARALNAMREKADALAKELDEWKTAAKSLQRDYETARAEVGALRGTDDRARTPREVQLEKERDELRFANDRFAIAIAALMKELKENHDQV